MKEINSKRYLLEGNIEVEVERGKYNSYLLLSAPITSSLPEEDKWLGEECQCWDATVELTNNGAEINGQDGPSGGSGLSITLVVPITQLTLRGINPHKERPWGGPL